VAVTDDSGCWIFAAGAAFSLLHAVERQTMIFVLLLPRATPSLISNLLPYCTILPQRRVRKSGGMQLRI
jgi:hypothetical protein